MSERLPELEVLRLVGPEATRARLPELRRWPHARSLARIELVAPHDAAEHAREIAAWRACELPVVIAMFDEESQRASGWSVEVASGAVTLEGYLASATSEHLAEIERALGARATRRACAIWDG